MKALLLAAGRSKRMAPVSDKNFLKFLGKPLIRYQIDSLLDNGFDEIVIMAGAHNLESIKELAESIGPNIQVIEQQDLDMGMCGALLSAKDAVSGGPLLVFSSNDVVDESAFRLINEAREAGGADALIIGKKVEEYFPGGYLEIDDEGYIQHLIEKPEPGTEPSDMVNLVVHYFDNAGKLIEYLEKSESDSDDLYEVALASMMKDGLKFKALPFDGFWQPIKFPWHVQKVFRYFFDKAEKKISDTAKISDNAVVNGDVIIGENVKIFDGAVVNGPAYIGDNSVVATNALVRESNVGENCVVGFSTEVARSFLGSDVWTHSNYIGDSVIGNDVSFGAGTLTGNLRLDEKNISVSVGDNKIDIGENKFGLVTGDRIRVGVNTSFMPGVKLGSDSFVGAGIVVGEDIPGKSFVRGSWELKISENKASVDASSREEIKKNLE